MKHWMGNVLAAVDLETSGFQPKYHEVLQVAIVLLNEDFEPTGDYFYRDVAPLYPERADPIATGVHGLDPHELARTAESAEDVADALLEWFEKIDRPADRCLLPLAHNWAFEASFLKAWLGATMMGKLFHGHARDGMLFAASLNDRAAFAGKEIPFPALKLGKLCEQFEIEHGQSHDALADCYAEAKVYKRLLTYDS